MNLFNNPSISALSTLINKNQNLYSYSVVVDHDGEVILKASNESSEVLDQYKFYFSGIQKIKFAGINDERDLKFINQLYKNLMFCWENDLNGFIDYNIITNIQFNMYWLEMKKVSSAPALINTSPIFFKDMHRFSYSRFK